MSTQSIAIKLGFIFFFAQSFVTFGKSDRIATLETWNINFNQTKYKQNSNYTTTISPNITYGIWEGWGTSLCWWGSVFGDRNDLADLFFTLKDNVVLMTANGNITVPGLGLNIARYNAGGSGWRSLDDGTTMISSPNIPEFKQIEGFWLDNENSDPSSSSFDWSVDQNQLLMLTKAQDRGCNLLELFSNSPMWWQLINENPSGNDDGSKDNLQSSYYNDHAHYLAVVAKYAYDNWNIKFDSVESLNEPISDWWVSTGYQEGCHFNIDTQANAILLLRQALNDVGLGSNVIVSASDENSYDEALSTWQSFNDTTQQSVGRVNVHGYQQGGGRRDLLYTAVNGKKLWNSEYGDGDVSGISIVSNLNLDFKWLHNTAWVYWQMVDEADGWGMLQGNMEEATISQINDKHYMMAQYSRHIKPGMIIMETSGDDTIAAYDSINHILILVSTCYNANGRHGQGGRWMIHDLSSFTSVLGPITRWNTSPYQSNGDRYVQYNDTFLNDKDQNVVVWVESYSTQTIEIQNVVI
mmetsp:Transcript_48457/g.62194  ORF Transcript_48457/g.62194 Transcript_48457/m.62194 type:complete len:524 (+) Transcript_48457:119-1690(+)